MRIHKILLYGLFLMIGFTSISCASNKKNKDPATKMRLNIEKHVDDIERQQQALSLLDEYLMDIQNLKPESRLLIQKWWDLHWEKENNQEELDVLYEEMGSLRWDFRMDILDIEDDFRDVLTDKEWKKVNLRSLIVFSEYYLGQEYGR
jgi:hypothetical protein